MWVILLFVFILVSVLLFSLHIFTRLSCGLTRSPTCLVGKTALITGANSGLGYETALNLASRGCTVIMADVVDMEKSKLNIIKSTTNANIFTKKLDLTSLESVRNFADDIIKTHNHLHILINNAGIAASVKNRTMDGLHPVMQVNYFGHFLLTHLLINLLQKSAPSRIVFTSSLMSYVNNLSVANLNFDMNEESGNLFGGYRLYANSKLAIIVASDMFAEKLKHMGVTSNCVHPGLIRTQMFMKSYCVTKNVFYLIYTKFCHAFLAKDAWEGSQVLVHVAVSQELETTTGVLFSDCKPYDKPSSAYDKKWCQEIWNASEEYVHLKLHEKL